MLQNFQPITLILSSKYLRENIERCRLTFVGTIAFFDLIDLFDNFFIARASKRHVKLATIIKEPFVRIEKSAKILPVALLLTEGYRNVDT